MENSRFFPEVYGNFGFGCMRLPMKGGSVDYEEFCRMADAFIEAGFNYFDTAHAYLGGLSETAIRDCVAKRYPREKFLLTNKLTTPYFNKQEDIRPFVESQLKLCGVDYFDFYLMHAQDRNNYQKYKRCKAYETCYALKQEGMSAAPADPAASPGCGKDIRNVRQDNNLCKRGVEMNKKRIRQLVDIGMVILLPLLMAYSLLGEKFHEMIGTVMAVLFVIHLIQNRKWVAAIPKGRYNARRVFQTALDLMLLMFMILQPLSGILMSKHLYTFIQISGISSVMRGIHMALAYWGFVLMSIHAGTHLQPLLRRFRTDRSGLVMTGSIILTALICLYGIYAFVKRQIPSYMFLQIKFAFFDFSASRILFILDYLAVMVLFAVIGLLISAGLSNIGKRKR